MRTFKIRLYNSDHNKKIDESITIAWEIYNHCIALHRRYFRLYKKHLSKYGLMRHLTKLKKSKYPHWSNLNSQAIQDIADRIDHSYKAFFSHIKEGRGGKKSTPHFRKRDRYYSFTLKQTGYKFSDDNSVVLMGRKYKYFKSQEIVGNIKTVTVKKTPTGKYFLYVVTDANFQTSGTLTGKSVGIDFGLKDFLVLDDGTKIDSPEFLKQSLPELRRLSRNFSRKEKNSRNSKKAYLELVRLHEKVANQRRDWFFRLATWFCKNYDIIGIEDLNLKAMQMLWGRKISDVAYGEFVLILNHVARKHGKQVVKVDRFAPSTKVCSECGTIVTLSLKDREWICPSCGEHHDRDINAAKNIRNMALKVS